MEGMFYDTTVDPPEVKKEVILVPAIAVNYD